MPSVVSSRASEVVISTPVLAMHTCNIYSTNTSPKGPHITLGTLLIEMFTRLATGLTIVVHLHKRAAVSPASYMFVGYIVVVSQSIRGRLARSRWAELSGVAGLEHVQSETPSLLPAIEMHSGFAAARWPRT